MLTPTGRTNGPYGRISVTTSRIKIDTCMEEADRSNASAVVHKRALVQIAEAGHARGKLARRWS